MRRDIGNELVVALIVVGVLAFTVTFAIILSLSGTPANPTATPGVPSNVTPETAVVTGVNAAAPSATPSEAAATGEGATPSPQPTDTATSLPASPTQIVIEVTASPEHPTAQPSATPQPPTKAPPQATITPPPTTPASTVMANPSSTPTATATQRPTLTFTPTASHTPRPTATATPSATPTKTPTATYTPTPTNTPTASNTPTRTPRPTETSGIRPTPTGTLTPVATTSTFECEPAPANWVAYTIQRGDTLSNIARAVNTTVSKLQRYNCISNPDNIYAGLIIRVPQLPLTVPGQPTPTMNGELAVEGCTDPSTQITNLRVGKTISGVFTLMGTASVDSFWYYKIEVRPDFTSVYNFYSRSETPIIQGELGRIDTTIFGPGRYWIRLTVVQKSGGYPIPCAIPVIFQ